MFRVRFNFLQLTLSLLAAAALAPAARAVNDFGDILVYADAMYTGDTTHGYSETRVILENRSHAKNHVVTLESPNNSYGNSGNYISQLSRTVTIAPGARIVIPLLQPALPVNGDGAISVIVDRHKEGQVYAPNANRHCNYSRTGETATALISRTLDFDWATRQLMDKSEDFTAAKAIGQPDAVNSGDLGKAWSPDENQTNSAHWLELDYQANVHVNNLVIFSPEIVPLTGQIILKAANGSNLMTIPMSSGRGRPASYSGSSEIEYSFLSTSQTVKKVRLEFGTIPPANLSIDAVQISGSEGRRFAIAAIASSDNSTNAAPTTSGVSPPPMAMHAVRGSRRRSMPVPSYPNQEAIRPLRAESLAADWSDNWLGYSAFDAILLKGEDLSTMPPPVMTAMNDYLSAGGTVVIYGMKELPAAWHAISKRALASSTEYEIGFGHCFVFTSEKPASDQTVRERVREAGRYWMTLPQDDNQANSQIPIVKNLQIPARGIILVMLGFILVIGPANLIILSRKKRRIWVLWTIPVISIITTLFVFAYSLLREGITADARIAGLTFLDQTTHRATSFAGTAFYCPLTPSDGLSFALTTEAKPLVSSDYYHPGNAREVDWTQSQHYNRGWISSRVPAYFHLRKSQVSRERIQVINENGKLQMVNGLGVGIKSLMYADKAGKIYECKNVSAGQKADLILIANKHAVVKRGPALLEHDLGFSLAKFNEADVKIENELLPETYFAQLETDPFIENALGAAAKSARNQFNTAVYGVLDAGDMK